MVTLFVKHAVEDFRNWKIGYDGLGPTRRTMGVTGARDAVGTTARALVARVRAVSPESAVCVGLGVSNGRQAAEVAQFADGVIVGSALVRRLLDSPDAAGIASLARLTAELADGVRATAD